MNAAGQLKALLEKDCRISRVRPPAFVSDAEVNIVIVTVECPDGGVHTVKAYREEAQSLREFIRSLKQ